MGNMRYIGRMDVMVRGIHVYRPHVQALVKILDGTHGLRCRFLAVADDAGMTVEKPGHGRPRAAVFRSGHGMRCNVMTAHLVVFHASCKMFLRRTYVHHHLAGTHVLRHSSISVTHLRKHAYRGTYRHC